MNPFFKRSACLSNHTLQKYVANTLSVKERYEVEDHLLDCALCQAAVEGMMAMQSGGYGAQANEDLAFLEQSFSSGKSSGLRKPIQLSWWLLALVVLLTVAILAWLIFFREDKADQLYALYFVPPANEYSPVQLRGGQTKSTMHPILEQALNSYDDERYAAAISYFEKYLSEYPNDEQATLYKGVAHLELEQADKAIASFEHVIDLHPDQPLPAHWYLALAHLCNKDHAAARSEFQYLTTIESPFKEKAAAILAQL